MFPFLCNTKNMIATTSTAMSVVHVLQMNVDWGTWQNGLKN